MQYGYRFWMRKFCSRWIFSEKGHRCIFVVAAKQEVRREATLCSIDKHEHGPLARVGRSALWPGLSWRCRWCRGVIVIKCLSIFLTVLKIQRDVVTSVELIPFQNVTVTTEISTTINWHQLCYKWLFFSTEGFPSLRLPK